MGHIFVLLGKSNSGKDTIYEKLMGDPEVNLKRIVTYTTRPMRDNESEGVQYHFVTESDYQKFRERGKIIESRTYETRHGLWRYFTVEDDQIDLDQNSYLIIGALETYLSLKEYFGLNRVRYIYIEVEDSIRLERAILRERKAKVPDYEEMCERFLRDTGDFSDERLRVFGIARRFQNTNLQDCYQNIKLEIEIES